MTAKWATQVWVKVLQFQKAGYYQMALKGSQPEKW